MACLLWYMARLSATGGDLAVGWLDSGVTSHHSQLYSHFVSSLQQQSSHGFKGATVFSPVAISRVVGEGEVGLLWGALT